MLLEHTGRENNLKTQILSHSLQSKKGMYTFDAHAPQSLSEDASAEPKTLIQTLWVSNSLEIWQKSFLEEKRVHEKHFPHI